MQQDPRQDLQMHPHMHNSISQLNHLQLAAVAGWSSHCTLNSKSLLERHDSLGLVHLLCEAQLGKVRSKPYLKD